MKKALLVGAASVALAAMPLAVSFAADPPALTDNLTVNIGQACTFDRTSQSGLSGEIELGSVNNNFGSSTFSATCNNATGYDVNAEFTSLTGPGQAITYSDENPQAGGGTWTATVNGTNIPATGGTLMTADGVASNQTATVTYKVSVRSNQAAGTYTGQARYTLNQNQ